ncbi:MAG: PilZ domain-containing protein, partial [Salinispira sp.]
ILAYSMQTKGYFKKQLVREKITNCELIDISASGLAFSYPQSVPTPPPQLYSEFDLILEIDNNPIPLKGRIVRKFNDVNHIYFGIQFVDLSDIVKDRISRELYGDNYDSEVEIR